MSNHVFIATSLDGYIADAQGDVGWLPNPNEVGDMGYPLFIKAMDAIIMGKNTFKVVDSFGIDWPYKKPVFILSHSLKELPERYEGYKDQIFILSGSLGEVLKQVHGKGYQNLYIDGGKVIQAFLNEGLIDTMTITTIPKLLGSGIPLFENISAQVFTCIESKVTAGISQQIYKKVE